MSILLDVCDILIGSVFNYYVILICKFGVCQAVYIFLHYIFEWRSNIRKFVHSYLKNSCTMSCKSGVKFFVVRSMSHTVAAVSYSCLQKQIM